MKREKGRGDLSTAAAEADELPAPEDLSSVSPEAEEVRYPRARTLSLALTPTLTPTLTLNRRGPLSPRPNRAPLSFKP